MSRARDEGEDDVGQIAKQESARKTRGTLQRLKAIFLKYATKRRTRITAYDKKLNKRLAFLAHSAFDLLWLIRRMLLTANSVEFTFLVKYILTLDRKNPPSYSDSPRSFHSRCHRTEKDSLRNELA